METKPQRGASAAQRRTVAEVGKLGYGHVHPFRDEHVRGPHGNGFLRAGRQRPPPATTPTSSTWISGSRAATGHDVRRAHATHISGFCLWPSMHTNIGRQRPTHDVSRPSSPPAEARDRSGLYYSSTTTTTLRSRTRPTFQQQAYFDLAACVALRQRAAGGPERADDLHHLGWTVVPDGAAPGVAHQYGDMLEYGFDTRLAGRG